MMTLKRDPFIYWTHRERVIAGMTFLGCVCVCVFTDRP